MLTSDMKRKIDFAINSITITRGTNVMKSGYLYIAVLFLAVGIIVVCGVDPALARPGLWAIP